MESLKDSPETMAKPGGSHINFSITKSMPTIFYRKENLLDVTFLSFEVVIHMSTNVNFIVILLQVNQALESPR